MTTPPILRTDDPPSETVLATTKALCPHCLRLLPAQTIERDDRVLLRRECPEHGPVETLVLSDASWWRWSRRFVRPGKPPAHTATETVDGCPYDCGFCPEHSQHACVTVFEITEACNLACPACFAGDAHVEHRSLDDVRAMADAVLRAEGGTADVVMLSGGEPTLHPQFFEIADLVRALPIAYLVVNSNGVRMARDPDFAREIAARGDYQQLVSEAQALVQEALDILNGTAADSGGEGGGSATTSTTTSTTGPANPSSTPFTRDDSQAALAP